MPKPYSEFTNDELIALRKQQVETHEESYQKVSDELAKKNDGIDPLFEVEALLNIADNVNHSIEAAAKQHFSDEEFAEILAEGNEVFERVVDALNDINQTGSYRTTAFIRGFIQGAYQGIKQLNDTRLGLDDDVIQENLPTEIADFLNGLTGRYDDEGK